MISGTKKTFPAFYSHSSSTSYPVNSVQKERKNREDSLPYHEKKIDTQDYADHESVSTLSLTRCSFEQQQILQVLASVSINTIDGLERLLSKLRIKTGASSSKEAIQSLLDDGYLSSLIFKKHGDSSGTESRRKKMLRGVYFNKQAEHSQDSSTPSNVLSIPAYCSMCGANNSALYGPFIASDYRKLKVSEIIEPVFTGLPFNFTVTKQDAYGNTILSDSSSVLESIPALNGTPGVDLRTSILGSAVSKMSGGVASFQFAVKATFSRIDYSKQMVSLIAPIFLNLTGPDMESGVQMELGWVTVHVQQGPGVCPRGHILVPDKDGEVDGPAVCTLCRPGSYSLSPLAGSSTNSSPSCLSCPIGCDCVLGGSNIQNKSGLWEAVEGVYRVISCPAGSQLINSTAGTSQGTFSNSLQQCKACLPGQYIINPDTDTCQECPPGSSSQQSF